MVLKILSSYLMMYLRAIRPYIYVWMPFRLLDTSESILEEFELLLGCIQIRDHILVISVFKTGNDPLGAHPITPNTPIGCGARWIGRFHILVENQFSKKRKRTKLSFFLYVSPNSIKLRVICLWSWVDSQALVTIVEKLAISGHWARSCIERPTIQQHLSVYSRGNAPYK